MDTKGRITIRDASPVLDYDPAAIPGPYICGHQIAEVLRTLTEQFTAVLPDDVFRRLQDAITELRLKPARDLAESHRSHHRLTRFAEHMPVYTAMFETNCAAPHFNLIAPARLVLLLNCYGALDVQQSIPTIALSNVCRNWTMHHDHPLAVRVQKLVQPLISQCDWKGAREKLRHFRKDTKGQPDYPDQMDKLLGTLSSALSILEGTAISGAVETVIAALGPLTLGDQVFEELTEPDTGDDSESVTLVALPDETDSRIPNATQPQRTALATMGQRLLLIRRWGMVSEQALQPVEAREAVSHLETILANSSGHRLVAASTWLTAALTGHRYDALLCALLGEWPDPELRPRLEIEAGPDGYTLRVPCLRWHRVARVAPELLPNVVHGDFSLALPAQRILSLALSELQRLKGLQAIDVLIDDIKLERARIRDDLRRQVDRFSEARIRGALAQAALAQKLDLPLVQLLMHEPLGSSCESLHYYGTDQKTLQSLYRSALGDLYDGQWQVPNNPDPDRLVGAPMAHAGLKHAPEFAGWIDRLPPLPIPGQLPKRIQRLIWDHNRLCAEVMWALHVTTGHRGNGDLDYITRRQFSLQARAVIYSDKPSDPSGYRRLCVYPDLVADCLQGYIRQLHQLADALVGNDTLSSAHQAATGAIAGMHPLFFRLTDHNGELAPVLCSIRRIWSEVAPNGMPVNSVRHALATRLREQGLAGIWVEQQLGHVAELQLVGQEGPISVPELADALQPALAGYAHWCGFVGSDSRGRPKANELPASLYRRDFSQLWSDHRDCLRDDERRLRKQLGLNSSAGASGPLQAQITRVLAENVPGYDPHHPPHDIYLAESQIRKLAEYLIQTLSRTSDLRTAIKQLQGRLRYHRHRHGWRLTIPQRLCRPVTKAITITPAALQAYDTLQALRGDLVSQWRRRGLGDSVVAAALALMLWGHITDRMVLESVISGLPDATWFPEHDCLLIPRADTGETFAVTGLAAAAALALKKQDAIKKSQRIPQLNARVWKTLPAAYRPADTDRSRTIAHLGHLVDLARRLEAPGLLAAAESGELATRQLDMHRMRMWASGVARPNAEPVTTLPFVRPQMRLRGDDPPGWQSEKACLKRMLKVFADPAEFWRREGLHGNAPSGRRTDSVHRAINAWLSQRREEPPLATMTARWVDHLTTPGGNRRSGRQLAKSTVKKYAHVAGHCMIRALAGLPLSKLDTETIEAMLIPVIDRRPDPALAAYCVTRLFGDLAGDYDLSPVVLADYRKHGSAEHIDACVVTDAEMTLVMDALRQSSSKPSVPISQRSRFLHCAEALSLMRAAGLRRAEVQYLRCRDLRPDRGMAYVRRTPQRDLKSNAAERVISGLVDAPSNPLHRADNELQWPTLVSERALDIGSALLERAVDNPHARLHHLRHSRATECFRAAFDGADPASRVVALHRLTAELGHSTIGTTLSHYVHMAQLLGAVHYSSPVQSAGLHALAVFLGITGDLTRQRHKRARTDVSPNARLLGMKRERSCEGNSNRLHLAYCISTGTQLDLSVERVNRFVHTLCRGRPLFEAIDASNITETQLATLVETLDRVARTVGWSPIPLRQMWKQLDTFGIERPVNRSTQPIDMPDQRRTVLHRLIEQWTCATAIADLAPVILNAPTALQGLRWHHPRPMHLPDPTRSAMLQDLAAAVSAPVTVGYDETLGTKIICLQSSSEQQHPPTLRYLLFVILVIARLREEHDHKLGTG